MRIGQGVDVHAFDVEGSATCIRLAGIDVPHTRALIAHSDGDVATHALMDALLGAAALGDIGQHFSDRDPQYADADSLALLAKVMSMVFDAGFTVSNVDLTVIAEQPKLAKYTLAMREVLAQALDIQMNQVNVKATTTEKLGFVGREEGIAAMAVVMLQ
jgi:2-C-methyl-D-erythritol 2,4-cyclodiphosphate synthase